MAIKVTGLLIRKPSNSLIERATNNPTAETGVAYKEDIQRVMEVIKQVGEERKDDPDSSDDITEPIEAMGLNDFGDSAIVLKARIKTRPLKQWSVGSEFIFVCLISVNRYLEAGFNWLLSALLR